MAILDLFFPKKCLECGLSGKYICENCLKKVPPRGWTSKTAYTIFKYEGVIRKAIISLKYKYSTDIAEELATHLTRVLKRENINLDEACLVPIPLHWYRYNFRGFNQSEVVGRLIAKKMDWKFIPDLLIRNKSTVPQVQLTGSARRKNLRGAFVLNPVCVLHSTYYILFDDVLTTGSTLLEASKVLRAGGAKRILCLTIAK
ncbi:hypothetical protein CO176_01580 [Candidatus Woesebacteria bacterium CG_4_9_14_3_um_filter_39_10]|uniref:Phosphoribosyltransferase domain-containing protein n=1 Tax=Candidatus Woesebacteria bacterium CG_4_9_14_3_um_filter_39_10 TaxID=1975056 RepID=A0A2M7X9F2_9BACT|nr:MAG: hypothetical protein CO176_01580 [Candidatus Woesebacteria bacterium CG_4_9_14_3_um_filter_39_10]